MGKMIRLDDGEGETREERRARVRSRGRSAPAADPAPTFVVHEPSLGVPDGPHRLRSTDPIGRAEESVGPGERVRVELGVAGDDPTPNPRFAPLRDYERIGTELEEVDDQILALESRRAGLVEELGPIVEQVGDPLNLLGDPEG